MMNTECVVVGGGPAGMVLGLLLARRGVRVTVLEKHSDFLRDFRGDTVHASTLALLDELGLGERFAAMPHRDVERMAVRLDAGEAQIADFRRLPGAHKHIAFAPQWDLLDLLAAAAVEEPTFTLVRNAEVTGLLRERGAVAGVRYRDRETGEAHTLGAALTVACDGRSSAVRAAAGLAPRRFGVPMDVVWFRLPRERTDPDGVFGRLSAGRFAITIDRGDYWQCAYVIPKGRDAALRSAGIEGFRRDVAALLPWTADRLDSLASLDDVKLLDVELNRLRRWYAGGLLLLGDAAHAMSPVGGVGINLAVADAVAAARIVGPALRSDGAVPPRLLRRVQRRRWLPTALIQGVQRGIHRAILARALTATPARAPAAPRLPQALRVLRRFPALQGVTARMVAIGPLPEHAPPWARRPAARSAAGG
ncbi:MULTISPECIES: FAD-dependent oxidoreductase [Tsukamurella]|uniref:FAD-dependent oxidoreductase n=2 Tax=Tsukamurella TaxID=2060 RepID=A0A5C5RW67_9ACTN|nr:MULTISPECIES: FAD-dependent oxidoreductase [Tsukamurella]NMD56305.1 FAD-dependent oxidoreductase [Tsukamurella columbiensis]TWS26743.1 FAD-dependent oxidoreductase [Tsukamurella conjunctivitidis]